MYIVAISKTLPTQTSAALELRQFPILTNYKIFGIRIPSLTISFIEAKNMLIVTSMSKFSRSQNTCVVFVFAFSNNPALKFRFVPIGTKIR